MSRKVVMTGTLGVMNEASIQQLNDALKKRMPEIDFEFLFDAPQDAETLIKAAKGAEILISQYQFMTEEMYDALLPELKAFVAYGMGYNSANLEVATKKGIYVCNVPNYCQEEVAVHVMTLMLAVLRHLPSLEKWIAEDNWGGGYKCMVPCMRFSECTVGLYGFGRIARYVHKMLSGFGCRVIAFDAVVPAEAIREAGAEPVDFDTLLAESDILSLHVPLLPVTQGTFTKEVFAKMKPTAIFINCARGGLCVPEDLYEALSTGVIAAAGLDAFITEPPTGIEYEIKKLPNVIATPHVGYYSAGAMVNLLEQTADVVVALLKNEDPGTLINREIWKA